MYIYGVHLTLKAYEHSTNEIEWKGRQRRLKSQLQSKGYRMVPSHLKVLAKFGLCSNCSQKLDECSLACARQIFARARMLGFSLNFPAV